jgi:hypothetical protein
MLCINDFGLVVLPMCVMVGQICGGGLTKISLDFLPNSKSKILPDDIHSSHLHAHPLHHLLTCSDDVNQWFWSGHIAHVCHGGSDLWWGFVKNQPYLICPLFRAKKSYHMDIHRSHQLHAN